MSAEPTFDVPDLDLPPPRTKTPSEAPKQESVYEAATIDIEEFASPEIARVEPEPIPKVDHVDQAIFDAVAAPPTLAPAVTSTTRCIRCTHPIALHARTCPHCAALVVPVAPYGPPAQTFTSEPVTLWSRIVDVLSTIPYGIWKRSAAYTFLIAVIGNACTCRKMSLGMNIVCALVIAISLFGIGACVKSQRSP